MFMFRPKPAVPAKQRCRPASSKKHQVPFKSLLVDNRSALERRKNRSFRLRQTKSGLNQRIDHKRSIDRHQKLLEPGAPKRRHGNRFTIAQKLGELLRRNQIHLVQDLDDGLRRNLKLSQNLLHLSLLLLTHRAGAVLHMKQNLGALNLLKSGAKTRDQRVRKIPDKPDRIGEQDLAPRRQLQLSKFGVERSKHPRRFKHAGLRQRIEQRTLPRVGIPHKRNHRHRNRLTPLPLLMSNAPNRFQLRLDMVDAQVDLATIRLELRLTRTPRSNAAAKLRHRSTASRQTRQLVLQLRKLHLKLAFASPRVPSKDVQDQLRSIDHMARKPSFNVAKLRWGKVVVKQNQRRVRARHHLNNLFKLALTDQTRRIGPLSTLHQSRRNRRSRRSSKLLKLRATGLKIERRSTYIPRLFFSSHNRRRGPRQSSRRRYLLAFAELSRKLHHHNHSHFLLSL